MLEEYDIKNLNPRPNPYVRQIKKPITIRISPCVIEYFQEQARETGVSYQTLIDMYLVDCANTRRKIKWVE